MMCCTINIPAALAINRSQWVFVDSEASRLFILYYQQFKHTKSSLVLEFQVITCKFIRRLSLFVFRHINLYREFLVDRTMKSGERSGARLWV